MKLEPIQSKIYEIRGIRVMLDFDIAGMYGIETKRLKEAVRRNIKRFEGDDFMFELSKNEYNELKMRLRSQFATLNKGKVYEAINSLAEQKKLQEAKPRHKIGFVFPHENKTA